MNPGEAARACEARNPCLAYAMDNPELEGIWGGLTEQERRQARSEARTGTLAGAA